MNGVFLGVFFHWLGGLASGSFYVPYKAVRKWSWEVYWLAGGFASWIFAPWILAAILTKGLCPTIIEGFRTAPSAMGYAYLFGLLWGVGGLTFGLTMRYLGMGLGMAIALGYCTVLGTIMPPVVDGSFMPQLTSDPAFVTTILGLGVCALGIILAGIAGFSKEREMDEESKKAAIKEFNLVKGILIATVSGVFSACMAYGLQAAEPLARISVAHGTDVLWSGLPKLCVVLLGGFTTNFIWCAILLAKNKTTYQFFNKEIIDPDAPKAEGQEPAKVKVNMIWNYFWSAVAGTTWYFQFFFYSMGETKMGDFKFSSWTLHMASIIIFSSLWGLALREWKGTSRFTKFILTTAIGTLLYSTIVVGYGNLNNAQKAELAIAGANLAVQNVEQAAADNPESAALIAEAKAELEALGAQLDEVKADAALTEAQATAKKAE
ncbi:MAG: L-rhamnose/proton symporter RhaT, partial [Thermoguttaceae bacterium]|nr:L-rhamnose/proton symporter RhaT [Thermoguttaceae bacterium]